MRLVETILRACVTLLAFIVIGVLVSVVIGGALGLLWQITLPPVNATINAWAQIGVTATAWVHGALRVAYLGIYLFGILVFIAAFAPQKQQNTE